jgi:hypothetical protein
MTLFYLMTLNVEISHVSYRTYVCAHAFFDEFPTRDTYNLLQGAPTLDIRFK